MSNIVMVIARSLFRDEELFHTKEELEKAGHVITIASSSKGLCKGSRGGTAIAEISLNDIDITKTDALVFVGGPGTSEYFESEKAHLLAYETLEKGKVLAAICIAPVILAKAGILKGKNATVFESGSKLLKENGANYTGMDVTVDGNIVTGNGPKAAVDFARAISALLDD